MFEEVKATNRAIASRKSVYGIGINDAEYMTSKNINGKHHYCPYHQRWRDMLKRCYHLKYLEKFPTYKGCSVVKEWHTFSVFKIWMLDQDWENKTLDKDLLYPKNKIYSPTTCCFITQELNKLITNNNKDTGYPQGVGATATGKLRAYISIQGKDKHLGTYDTQDAAEAAYLVAKIHNMLSFINSITDPKLTWGVLGHVRVFQKKLAYLVS